jgi:hypothetical protein
MLLISLQSYKLAPSKRMWTVLEYRVLLPCWNWLGTRGIGSLHKDDIMQI